MRIGRGAEEIEVKITINGEEVEQVKSFCYLGSVITTDARCHKDIKRRIALGKEAFTNRGELMRGGLSKNLKKRLVKTLVWSVVLYGSETWTIRKEDIKRLEAWEMWIWRRMEKVSWTEHMTNEEVLQRVEKKVTNNNIKRKTKELDWTYTSRRFPLKRYHRGEDEGEKDERKAAADDAGRDDEQWIRRTEGKSTTENRMASLEVGTCRRAEHLKKKSGSE